MSTQENNKQTPDEDPLAPAPISGISPVRPYHVAAHSLSISRCGFAVDPQDLKFPEIIINRAAEARKLSLMSFDSNQLGHKILDLIRGFWSQPGFPYPKLVTQFEETNVATILKRFSQFPLFPHRQNMGRMSAQPTTSTSNHVTHRLISPPPTPRNVNYLFTSWIPRDKANISELIFELCQKMSSIFLDEPRVIRIDAPCLVLGDIHGNLTDLRTYEHTLWPKAPSCCTHNYLFLGDYVDRGDYSVECILYLFAMKSLSPKRFHLLRGNHEVAAIQKQYTFSQECEQKFGLEYGRRVWRELNKVFDMMPLAAIVDDSIFCAHGGIPKSISEISRLTDEIPCPLDNPEFQCPAAWEILWNDPITDQELIAMLEMDNATINLQEQQQQQQQQATINNQQQESRIETAANDIIINADNNNHDASSSSDIISNYIIPGDDTTRRTIATSTENQSNQQTTHTSESRPEVSYSDSRTTEQQQQQQQRPPETTSNDNQSTTLRKVPSDTSSIASTSPQQIMNDGFIANIKRGTGYLFSDQAIDKFLRLNRLSHVIRAHEVIPTGFTFHGDGRVITIFSSSKYCGLENQAACALVDSELIRILRLETGPDLD